MASTWRTFNAWGRPSGAWQLLGRTEKYGDEFDTAGEIQNWHAANPQPDFVRVWFWTGVDWSPDQSVGEGGIVNFSSTIYLSTASLPSQKPTAPPNSKIDLSPLGSVVPNVTSPLALVAYAIGAAIFVYSISALARR